MPISINGAFNGLPPINDTRINQQSERIGSGQRINSAADDPAGLAISNRFDTQIGGQNVAIRNAGDGISLTQLGSGALSQVTENLQRIRDLSLQAANGTLNDQDRQALQAEADQLSEATRGILQDTSFNGVDLFTSDSEQRFQVGASSGDQIAIGGSNLLQELDSAGLNALDISSPEAASQAISAIDNINEAVNSRQAEFGAVANRFEATIDQLQVGAENAAAARSRIADTDIAQAASALTSEQIRNQAQIAVRAQANGQAQQVLQLLGGRS